jgi:non-ribosomal peptide synthetase component F
VFVPIDPAYPAERIEFILQDADCETCLIHKSTRHLVPNSFLGRTVDVDEVIRQNQYAPSERVEKSGGDLCYIMYTRFVLVSFVWFSC